MYSDYKIYGPYLRYDGRMHMVLVGNGSRTTVSYPKYLVECSIGRYLKENETIDHLDEDFTNNDLSNLSIKDRVDHVVEDAIRSKGEHCICLWCGSDIFLVGKKLSTAVTNRKRGKSGPFCSRSCSGKYGASVQNGGEKFDVEVIRPVYIKNKCECSPTAEATVLSIVQ